MRLFEAQGVLDLYLVGMRRIEEAENRPIQSWRASKAHPIGTDERDCRHGECGHYPSLILKGFEGRGPQVKEQQPEGDTIIVRREEVMKHLTRRGAHTDSFEHPIIFSQSDLRLLAQDDDGIITIDYEQQRVSSFYPESDYDDDNGDLDNMLFRFNDDDFSQYDHRPVRPASPTESDMSADDTFDLLQHDGISALANSVLRRTPKVLNLSLTGFLSHCIQQPKPSLLRTLRCLSLGPPAQPPGAVFLFQELWLPAMEKLRFSGSYLGWSIARRIAGNDSGNWRAMREAQWDFGSSKIPGAGGNNVTW